VVNNTKVGFQVNNFFLKAFDDGSSIFVGLSRTTKVTSEGLVKNQYLN
jgi:hypothetical protein